MSAPFDPAGWLDAFKAAEVWWFVGADERVMMGWGLGDAGPHDPKRLQLLFDESRADPGQWAALIAYILSRQHIPA